MSAKVVAAHTLGTPRCGCEEITIVGTLLAFAFSAISTWLRTVSSEV